MTNANPRYGVVRRLGIATAAMLALAAVSPQRAEALSLATPGTVPSAHRTTDGLKTEVRFGGHGGGHHGGGGFRGGGGFHGGGFRGGGAAFHGGGFRGGGVAFHGGGYRAAPLYHGGGYRYGGFRRAYHGGYPYAYHHRPHFRRHFYRPAYYQPYYSYPRYVYPRRHCRVIWTYYGPRKICRPWHRHHYGYRYW